MTAPSALTVALFLALVAGVVALAGVALRRACAGAPASRFAALAAAGLATWVVAPAVLARTGVLDRWTMPPPALLLVAGVTLCTCAVAASDLGGRMARAVPLVALVGFQVFRVPLEVLLHRLFVEGVVPFQMTFLGRNFDIASGVTAAAVALYLAGGRRARAPVLAWNLLGLALLANIVVIAVLSTPVPFRQFMNEPANRLPGQFPFVWLPTVLVQAALLGHLLVFRALARRPED